MNRNDTSQIQTFHPLDYVAVLRPTLLFPVWTLVLLGYHHGRTSIETPETVQSLQLWVTLCLYTLLMGAVYIINQIADKETDAANDKLYLVAQGYVKLRILKWQIGILITLSTLLSLLVFWENPAYLILILLSTLLGFTYSVRPFRLKGIPIVDLCANALGYGSIAFLIGWLTIAPIGIEAVRRSLPYLFSVAAAFVNTTLPDIKGDRLGDDRTTGVWLGKKLACRLSLVLLVAAIVSSAFFKDWIAGAAGVGCLPIFIYMNFRPEQNVIVWATRIGILILSLCAGVLFPLYLLWFGIVLFGTRWYYTTRFGIRYP
ncbi:UbiA family prenyltransferase [Candidatus Poribacteria bacterium]|nr:UbiA family prenyltransferase [Candidatus Poribacteria bacterium]